MFDFNKVKVIGVTTPVADFIPDSEGIVSYAARGEQFWQNTISI